MNDSIDWLALNTSAVVGKAIIEQAQENNSKNDEIIMEAFRIWREPTIDELEMIYDRLENTSNDTDSWYWAISDAWWRTRKNPIAIKSYRIYNQFRSKVI